LRALILLTKLEIINTNARESDECDYQNAQQNNLIESDNFWTCNVFIVNKSKHMSKNKNFTMTNKFKYCLNFRSLMRIDDSLKYWLLNMHSRLKNIILKYLWELFKYKRDFLRYVSKQQRMSMRHIECGVSNIARINTFVNFHSVAIIISEQ